MFEDFTIDDLTSSKGVVAGGQVRPDTDRVCGQCAKIRPAGDVVEAGDRSGSAFGKDIHGECGVCRDCCVVRDVGPGMKRKGIDDG